MASTFASSAQIKPYNATLGFNYNNSQRVPSSVIESIFENTSNRDAEHNTTLNRVFSDYGMGFTTPRKHVFIDLSILQGTDYWYSNTYRSETSNDTNYTYYDYTLSLCPECLKRIDAKIVFENDKVYMLKRCPEHGKSKVLIADDIPYYKNIRNNF